ncbi:MAG: hypothetical protein LW695_09200 [Phenylobacterium sp.]|nr:hypothetical protein [Phenylobacterium sp.]
MTKMTPAEAMTAMLEALAPSQRPFGYGQLLEAAQALTSSSATQAALILGVLGTSQFARIATPPPVGVPLSFPADHRVHLENSEEWYWISANLTASDGVTKLGVLTTTQSTRLVPQDIQASAGWSDAESHVAYSATTVAVNDGTRSFLVRRKPNVKWRIGGDDVVFPSVDQPLYRCGDDVMTWGSDQVLPLRVQSGDGDMSIDLTLSTDMPLESAWFLQALAGRSPPPRPGIYYSWPQLKVTGTVTLGETVYEVSGTGWIDHQLMMATPPDPIHPPPPIPPPTVDSLDRGYSGWQWCQFNFENGDAYTGATFQDGPFRTNLKSTFSGYITKVDGAWVPQVVEAEWRLDALINTLFDVLQPTEWTYQLNGAQGAGSGAAATAGTIVATPLHADGSYLGDGLGVLSEVAATVILTRSPEGAPPTTLAGAGYCETVDAEPRAFYVKRALAILAGEAELPTP